MKATPDADFDPSAHIQIDNEEKEYQRLLNEGKTLQRINTSGVKIEINDLDKYCFHLITKAFIYNVKDNKDKDWYLEKYLKPNYYENNLFCL